MPTRHLRVAAATIALFVTVSVLSPTPPQAQGFAEVIAWGLDNPRDLRFGPDGLLYVIEAGRGGPTPLCLTTGRGVRACYGATGAVTRIDAPGVFRRVLGGLPSVAPSDGSDAIGPSDFDFGLERGWIVVGLDAHPGARAAFDAAGVRLGTLIRVDYSGRWDYVADIAAHEAVVNPDGGAVLSNPYSIRMLADRAIVADAGANAILSVSLNSQVSTIVTLPPQSEPKVVTDGPDGFLYIGEFGQGAGSARVLRVSREGGTPQAVAAGFTNIIDIAFERSGVMWVLEQDIDGLAGPGVNGRLTRVVNGQPQVVTAGLTKPGGLALGLDGAIYVTNRSTSAGVGEVIRIVR